MKGLTFTLLLACAILGMMFGYWSKRAFSQDCEEGSYGCGHMEQHEQYKDWHRDSGMSCCSEGDCRPTRAYQDMNGDWHAWTGRKFVKVPREALLPPDKTKDGRSHVCAPRYNDQVIYCFSPAEPKS